VAPVASFELTAAPGAGVLLRFTYSPDLDAAEAGKHEHSPAFGLLTDQALELAAALTRFAAEARRFRHS
jgi:hypothetical protein